MIDFGKSNDQEERNFGPVPAGSIVWIKTNIQVATGGKVMSDFHPLTIQSANNPANSYISMKFEVVSGKYEGVNFWGNFVVDGSDAAKNISFSTFKSMIRAVRKLEKDDQRPNVFAINDWDELDHLTFPAKLKIKKPRSGDKFVNNELGLVIAPGHKSWDAVKDGGEIITDNEIPSLDSDIAQNQVQSQAGSNPAPNWTGDTPIVEDEIPF